MEQEKKQGIAFLILGSSLNTLGIVMAKSGLKVSFHSLGIIFLVIAIVKLNKARKAKKDN